MLHTARLSP